MEALSGKTASCGGSEQQGNMLRRWTAMQQAVAW